MESIIVSVREVRTRGPMDIRSEQVDSRGMSLRQVAKPLAKPLFTLLGYCTNGMLY